MIQQNPASPSPTTTIDYDDDQEQPQDLVSSLFIEAVEILVKCDTYPSAGMASRQVDP
jgi:hypothetical protein